MDNERDNHNLGPLPKSDRADELQQLGIDALRAALPKDRFLFRDERTDDKGVDQSLEIKINDRFTNLRSQVQLKSTDSEARNQDGSVSLPVETSNLNYLLNGPSPLYVLYVVPRSELRYVWAYEEWRRLDAENPGWRDQQKVTLRFVEVLTADRLAAIHDRIRREAECNRRIREILGRATIAEDVVVAVDPTSFQVTDPDELYQLVSTAGMTAVCDGYARQVLDRARLLDVDARNEPRIRLLCAYAEHTLGKYAAAFAHVVEITACGDQLGEYDRHFFEGLRDACLFQLGRITEGEYEERQAALAANATGVFLLQRQVNELKQQVLRQEDKGECQRVLDSFQELVDEIACRSDASGPFKLQARIELLKAQGSLLIDEFSFAATAKGLRGDLGMRYDTAESISRAKAVLQRMTEWVEMGNRIIQKAASLGHPILFANALLTTSSTIMAILGQRRILAGMAGIPQSMLDNLVEHIEKAIEVFSRAGALERELRARILRADLHQFMGETDLARKIAADVLPKAQAMDYGTIAADAEAHLSGESAWQKAEARTSAIVSQDHDPGVAQQSDEQVRDLAKFIHTALELPNDRLPAVERHCRCMRDWAGERLTWCRHLAVVGEDQTFATEPERRCACLKHRCQSNIGNSDLNTIIQAFKRAYCDGCPDREPKST